MYDSFRLLLVSEVLLRFLLFLTMRFILLTLLSITVIGCTIQKRVFLPGYSVEWKHKHAAKERMTETTVAQSDEVIVVTVQEEAQTDSIVPQIPVELTKTSDTIEENTFVFRGFVHNLSSTIIVDWPTENPVNSASFDQKRTTTNSSSTASEIALVVFAIIIFLILLGLLIGAFYYLITLYGWLNVLLFTLGFIVVALLIWWLMDSAFDFMFPN